MHRARETGVRCSDVSAICRRELELDLFVGWCVYVVCCMWHVCVYSLLTYGSILRDDVLQLLGQLALWMLVLEVLLVCFRIGHL